jgi:hypothetical protein
MTAERLAIVRSIYPPGGVDFAAILSDPEVEAAVSRGFTPYLHPDFEIGWGGTWGQRSENLLATPDGWFRSVDEWLDAYRELVAEFESFRIEPVEFFDLDDVVIAHSDLHTRSKRAGIDLAMSVAAIYRFDGVLIRGIVEYPHLPDAIRALGLERSELPEPDPA